MLVTLSGPWGLGKPYHCKGPPVALYLRVSGVARAWGRGGGWLGWGGAGRGVITHACEGKASEGNEVWRMRPISAGGPSLHSDTDPPASLSAVAHASRAPPHPSVPSNPLARPMLGQSARGALEGAPDPVSPAKQAPTASSRHFIALHQIKSNKLITNNSGHARGKYRINIIDLILSMLSEKKTYRCWGQNYSPTATIGRIKRLHKVRSTKINSSDDAAETLS